MSLKKLGRYELIRVLGKGAMGVVYEGRDPNLDRRVAIKTVKVENLSEEAATEYEHRFRTEARSAARLQHPNIVSVYDSDRDRLFFALGQFLADPARWPLLHLEGDVAVFGWRDPDRAGQGDPFRGWEVDLNRLAFRPAEDKVAGRDAPAREPRSRRWWEAFWEPAPPRPIDRDEATLHLLQADALRGSAHARHVPAAASASPSPSRTPPASRCRASTSSSSVRSPPTSASSASPTRTRARVSATRASTSAARSERLVSKPWL